jgi:hypothetical protein
MDCGSGKPDAVGWGFEDEDSGWESPVGRVAGSTAALVLGDRVGSPNAADSTASADVEVAMESGFRVRDGEGVSTNMMDGPVTSSDATAVRGVVFEVNLDRDWLRIGGGRAVSAVLGEDDS